MNIFIGILLNIKFVIRFQQFCRFCPTTVFNFSFKLNADYTYINQFYLLIIRKNYGKHKIFQTFYNLGEVLWKIKSNQNEFLLFQQTKF
jgi:hypothetical protein